LIWDDSTLSFWIPAQLALSVLRPRRPILGAELSGVIEETGKHATRFMKERGSILLSYLRARDSGQFR
jgi:hypothetical protein